MVFRFLDRPNIKAINWKEILCVSILISFTLCIFAPFEVYLAGKEGFFFSGYDIIGFSTLFFAFVTIAFLCIFLILAYFNKPLEKYVRAVCFGVIISLYLQGNYDLTDYGVWDGEDINWSDYIASKYIWLAVFAICIIAVIMIARRMEERKYNRLLKIVSVSLILIQTVTLITLLITNKGLDKKPEYAAIEEGECEFSADENLIVLILDSYDSMMLSEIIDHDENDHYSDILSDFVFYPDTVGAYSFTNLALPQIITGEKYYNDVTYGEYLDRAYDNSDTLKKLSESGWNIGLYTDSTFPQNSDVTEQIENCRLIKKTVTSHRRLAGYVYRIIGFRYLPQPLKKYCIYQEDLESEIGSNTGGYTLFGTTNTEFKRVYESSNVNRKGKEFRLIHIFGAHPPYYVISDETGIKEETTEVEVCRDNLELVDEFLDKLREIGAYDNSTIIICADHGVMQLRQAPLFLIKAREVKSHKMIVDNTPFSYDSLEGLLEKIIDGSDEKGIMEYINDQSDNDRIYLKYKHDSLQYNSYCGDIVEYTVSGPAYIESSLSTTGKVYTKP